MNLQLQDRMCETPIVAKLQHRILNRLRKPSFFFLTISILKFSFHLRPCLFYFSKMC